MLFPLQSTLGKREEALRSLLPRQSSALSSGEEALRSPEEALRSAALSVECDAEENIYIYILLCSALVAIISLL